MGNVKNYDSFRSGEGVCYVPEFTNKKYSRQDFLRIAFGDAELASRLFTLCRWEHPESLIATLVDLGLTKNYVYGEPLTIWVTDHAEPITPAHFVERKKDDSGIEIFSVNWEGRFLDIFIHDIRKIEKFNFTTFKGASCAGIIVPPVKKMNC